jgi:hypothetical protein
MVDHLQTSAERSLQNLGSATDIKSWDDFKDWYNYQLYLERQTIRTFENMKVNIGGKNYHFTDVLGIYDGLKWETIEFWDNEFTEEQRREMWTKAGLSPANYA